MLNKTTIVLLSLFVAVFASSGWAQEAAAVSGSVKDSTGAVLPGATLKLTSKSQGTVRQQFTNEAGVYQFTFLPPGTYDIEISMQGFSS